MGIGQPGMQGGQAHLGAITDEQEDESKIKQ